MSIAQKAKGMSVLLLALLLFGPMDRQGGAAAQECDVVLGPENPIQRAIEEAAPNTVICLNRGVWHENLRITKSVTLRGAGRDSQGNWLTQISALLPQEPIVRISSNADSELAVIVEGLLVTHSMDTGLILEGEPHGLLVQGRARAQLRHLKFFAAEGGRWSGLLARDSSQVDLEEVEISGSWLLGLTAQDSAQVSLQSARVEEGLVVNSPKERANADVSARVGLVASIVIGGMTASGSGRVELSDSTVSRGGIAVIELEDSAAASLVRTTVSDGHSHGIYLQDSATLILQDSRVTQNGLSGLRIEGVSRVEIRETVIEKNGLCNPEATVCIAWVHNGVQLSGSPRVVIRDSVIRENYGWGLAAWLRRCGHPSNEFAGEVLFEGSNIIEGNNTSNELFGMGNPGNHLFKDLPDGQVCLP